MAAEDQDFVVLNASDIQGFNLEGVLPLPTNEISEIQEWLAPTDYSATSSEYGKHCASHLAGTGTWILQTDQYQEWHHSDRGALWIKAIAGAGKSVIAASLISKLATEEKVPVLYFFFRHIISANQKPPSLVRDYISQVLEYSPTLQHSLHRLIENHRPLDSVSLDELWKMLVLALTRLPRVYCVADALDEMDAGNEFFLQDLVVLGQKEPTAIKVLMTSRPVPRVEQVLRHPSVLQIALQPRLVDPDISVYVRHRVSKCDVSEKISSKIHEKMCARADGHFLYARLMMDDLLEPSKDLLSRDEELVSALNGLPTPMANMYTQMLLDHSQRSGVPQELQLTLLQWVTRAERPLRLLELSSMIDFERKALGMSKETKCVVREGCGPLLEILEDDTVCPIHHSFTEYLYDPDRQYVSSEAAKFPILDYTEAQRAIAVTCIKYLVSGWHHDWQSIAGDNQSRDNERKPRALKLKYPLLDYAANNWHRHVRNSAAKDANMSSELDGFLVKDPEILPAWLELTAERGSPFRSLDPSLFKTWTPLHAAADKGLTSYVKHLTAKGHDIECLNLEQHTPLALAAGNGHDEVVAVLMQNVAQSDEADSVGLKPMHHAAMKNHHGVVKLLLESGVDPYTPKTKEYPGRFCGNAPSSIGDTPVKYACENGHVETIKTFLPYLKGDGLHRALYWAIRFGQTKVAIALLEAPDIETDCVVENQTLLYLASNVRDVEVMRLLLDMGADAHALSSNYMSHGGIPLGQYCYARMLNPLQAFARADGDHDRHTKWDVTVTKKGFEMLLDAGLDPNFVDPDGSTILHDIVRSDSRPLQREKKCGVEDVLLLLLDRGLSAISLTLDGSNALHLASGVSTTVIDMLIAHGVEINQVRKSDGKTPLMTALDRTDLVIAQHLLDRGADANITDAEGNTPLHLLAKLSDYQLNLDIVKALIAAGADVNQRNNNGNTPLHLGQINPKLLSLFLEHGLDLEAKNKKGHTLLFQSISRWSCRDDYKKLMDAGASPLTRDFHGSTVLHSIVGDIQAIGIKTTDLLGYFVEKNVDPLATDNIGNTLWHVVARQGAAYHQQEQLAVMNLLMEYGVSPTARNNTGQTPLHVAFSAEKSPYPRGPIEFLLEKTSPDVNVADYDKIRPIHHTSSGDPELTCRLLELGADPTMLTVEGQSPLMVACRTKQCNIVCILLDHHKEHDQLCLIDRVDNRGRSALHYACKSGIPETVALLLEAGANANLKDKEESSPLHMCAEYLDEQASWDKAEAFSQNQRPAKAAYVLLTDPSRPISRTPPRDPIRIRETIRLLIGKGADTSFLTTKPDYSHRKGNPLAYAISRGCEAMVSELLIIQDRLLQAKLPDFENCTASAEDTRHKIKESIDAVKTHWTSLLSSYHNRIRFLRMRHMPEIIAENTKPGENNVWFVQQLLREDDEPAVKEVSKLGARFLELDNGGDNPLFHMASWGFTDLMRNIGRDAARMNVAWTKEKAPLNINWREGRLKTILHTALTRAIPNLEMVKIFVSEFKLNLNEQFPDGSHKPVTQSFVHLVARPCHWWQTKGLNFLLENGADIEALNSNQETPLIVALRESYGNVYSPARVRAVEILLLHGANPNAVDKNGLTCLNTAAGQPSCVKLLLKHGANPSLGLRPFIFDVIKVQDLDTLRVVVESGADVNVLSQPMPKSEPHETDVFENPRRNDDPKTWADVVDVDSLSKCAYPIHVAASHFFDTPERTDKAIEIIKLLLGAGANPFLVYKDGTSIVHVLAEQGGILEPLFHHPSFDTESQDHRGRTLLLAACDAPFQKKRTSSITLPSLLLKYGASLAAVDREGRNALHCLVSALPQGKGHHSTFSSISRPFMPALVPKADFQGRTPFHYAVSASRFDLIDDFLSHGADPILPDPLDGSTALHHLATGLAEYTDIFIHDPEATMTADAIPEFSTGLFSDPSFDEVLRTKYLTPEKLARAQVRSPRRHMASLLASGLFIEARDHAGETPLFKLMTSRFDGGYAVKRKLFPALKVFEAAGANFQARNNIGESVLHKLATQESPRDILGAIEEGDTVEDFKQSFKWLVGKGVDLRWEDEGNRTCLDVAAATGAQWMLEMYKRK